MQPVATANIAIMVDASNTAAGLTESARGPITMNGNRDDIEPYFPRAITLYGCAPQVQQRITGR